MYPGKNSNDAHLMGKVVRIMHMQKNNIGLIWIFLLFFLFSNFCFSSSEVDVEALKKELQAQLDSLQKEGSFPGATVGIVLEDGTELALATGWADIEKKAAMKASDRMFTGSAGKTFVAAVALQLVQEGKLDLEKKVSFYLGKEKWFSRLPNHADLTVRMIMSHTGGLPRYVFKDAFIDRLLESPDKVWKPEELLAFVFDDPPAHPAGKGWSYSDTDYIVLGMIIEKISDNTFYNELDNRILNHYGLKDTSPSNKRKLEGLVTGYTADRAPPFRLPGKVNVDGVYPVNPQFEWCGGGLYTTSMDMARWSKLLYEGKVFSNDMLKEMLKVVGFRTGKPSEQGYGLGVMVFKSPFGLIYGHAGVFPGYQTQMSYFPDWKTAITMQVNADSFSGKLKGDLNRFVIQLMEILKKKGTLLVTSPFFSACSAKIPR
jgi:D-alanyl-D-alanine carboxypeptidase